MKSPLLSYNTFLSIFKKEAEQVLLADYSTCFRAAKSDLHDFLEQQKKLLVRWRNACILQLLTEEELKLIASGIEDKFLPQALAATAASIDFETFKKRMIDLLLQFIIFNAEAVRDTSNGSIKIHAHF